MNNAPVDFSNSIARFRVHPPHGRQGTPRPPRNLSDRGEMINFLSNLDAATEGYGLSDLLDVSENVIWNSDPNAVRPSMHLPNSLNAIHQMENFIGHPWRDGPDPSIMPPGVRALIDALDAGHDRDTIIRRSLYDMSDTLLTTAEGRSLFDALGSSPQVNHIVNMSLNDAGRYKSVLSEEGSESLKGKKYSADTCANDRCPIVRTSFDIDDDIVELPCGHCFNPEAINRWLNDEKAECPVCRHALKSKEIKKTCSVPRGANEGEIRNARITLLNSLTNTNNTIHPFGPRLPPISHRSIARIVDSEDNEELQEAILRSLRND